VGSKIFFFFFGKHPVDIDVKPGFKWYLTKVFSYALNETLLSSNNYATNQLRNKEGNLRPQKTLAFFEGSGAFRARRCMGGTRNVTLLLTERT
jgi:hypothetical protein